jgi:protein-L-isoaspartate(D-aspartate) O-methyltransferase
MSNDSLSHERKRMTELQIAARGITHTKLLEAFASVPREDFVPEELRPRAYDDAPLPIGGGQTISQPYIVARTLAALEIGPEDRVLEIGTGSGYAAAIAARVARAVFTVERIEWLAKQAEQRLTSLGFGNVRVCFGDGTTGWPEHAPYDAIAVAAGGPVVPQTLLDQLAVGGRLVMPVTSKTGFGQTLLRVRRVSENHYEEDDLEPVQFVPLIGARGHAENDTVVLAEPRLASPGSTDGAIRLVREVAEPFGAFEGRSLDALVERLASARVVLLGESTHGTAEFYQLRARITQRLIEDHHFDFVAAEADWADAARIDTYVRNAKPAASEFAWAAFSRFPTWMWRNEEVAVFSEWLRDFNRRREQRAGFHGLDLYGMYTSMSIVLDYLREVDPAAAIAARGHYARLGPWQSSPQGYAQAVLSGRLEPAAKAVVATLRALLQKRLEYMTEDGERFFDAVQNARVVTAAERFYRAMFYGAAESWNLRDSHMFDTLRILLGHYGAHSKGVVWAHNSHVGDARSTEMRAREEFNLGQLCRQAFGDDARLLGFSTDHGRVMAASEWDGPGQVMRVRPGHPESYEHVFHQTEVPAFVLQLRDSTRRAVRDELMGARLFRAIGVVYAPRTELQSHYLTSVLPEEFDELVWFDETHAVRPLSSIDTTRGDLPETYPFAV